MTPDEIIDLFADMSDVPAEAMAHAVRGWDQSGPALRRLLAGYVAGADLSERTERALLPAILLLAQMRDTASFPSLCALGASEERLVSAMGEDAAGMYYASVLASTFGGDLAPLRDLVEAADADEICRGDALLTLAYLTRTGQVAVAETYAYFGLLPARLAPAGPGYVWFGYARAVAALGFAGLASHVEAAIKDGYVDPGLMTAADFWEDLREAQSSAPLTARVWDDIGPIDDAAAILESLTGPEAQPAPQAPIRNALRDIGRNDPCPCGSGKKFKKCCLA